MKTTSNSLPIRYGQFTATVLLNCRQASLPIVPVLVLPRLGYVMKVPQRYENYTYYGRGPIGNYPDRKVGQFIEIHKSTVADQFVNFPKPQDMGNHEDVRWCALTDKAGKGAIFIATNRLSTSALQYSALDMILAGHPYLVAEAGDTYLHLDLAVTGWVVTVADRVAR